VWGKGRGGGGTHNFQETTKKKFQNYFYHLIFFLFKQAMVIIYDHFHKQAFLLPGGTFNKLKNKNPTPFFVFFSAFKTKTIYNEKDNHKKLT
jgi:hypothetical protein